jgi:hypothetical protein
VNPSEYLMFAAARSRFGVRAALAMLFPPDIDFGFDLPYDTRREEHSPMQNCLLSLLYSGSSSFAGSSS